MTTPTEDTARTRRTELYEKWLESPAAEAAFEEWVEDEGYGGWLHLPGPGPWKIRYVAGGCWLAESER
jgi:hypothetical protein